jgi:hypothetical protein
MPISRFGRESSIQKEEKQELKSYWMEECGAFKIPIPHIFGALPYKYSTQQIPVLGSSQHP